MANMNVSVLVKLVDLVTGPLRKLQAVFERFSAVAQKIGILGGAIAAISFTAPIQSAAAFDSILRDIAITAGQSGSAAERMIGSIGARYQKLALEVGQYSADIARGAQGLVAAGMDEALIDRLLPVIGRVATASGASFDDASKTAFALSNNLKVAAGDIETALAQLITAGKLGRFEFRDMAREFPELTAQYEKFGVTGLSAVKSLGAALQIAMFGTANPSTAANNFKNYLSKLLAPETIKNFQRFGVNIERVMKGAAQSGIDPITASIDQVVKVVGVSQKHMTNLFNDQKKAGATDKQAADAVKAQLQKIGAAARVTKLFGDMQVLDFLLPAMANIEKLKAFQAEIEGSGLGVIQQDFSTRMAGLEKQLFVFSEVADQFRRRVGLAFAQNLPWLNRGLMEVLGWVHRVDAAFPGLIDQVLTFAGAALVLVTGLALLGPVFSVLAAGIGVVAGVIGALLTPIGLLAAALAGAAVIIYANWDQFAPMLSGIWADLTATFGAAVAGIQALFAGDWAGATEAGRRFLAGMGRIGSGLTAVLGRVGRIVWDWAMNQLPAPWREGTEKAVAMLVTAFSRIGRVFRGVGIMLGAAATAIGERLSGVAEWARGAWDGFFSWLDGNSGGAFTRLGAAAGEAWSAIKTKAGEVWDWLKTTINEMASWSDEDWRQLGTRLGTAVMDEVEGLINWATNLPGRIGTAISGAAGELMEAGRGLIEDLWSGAKAKFKELLNWAASIPERIKAAIGSIDLSSMIKMPSLNFFGGGDAAPPNANDNAPASQESGTPAAPQKQSFAPTLGRSMASAGFAAPGKVTRTAVAAQAAPSQAEVSGRIVVEAAPGTRVREATSDSKSVAMVAGRGQVIGRA